MKKILFAFFLFLIIFIIQAPSRVLAYCYIPQNAMEDCKKVNNSGYIVCQLTNDIYQCCDTQAACDELKTKPPQCGDSNSPNGTCQPKSYVCVTTYPGQLGCKKDEKCGYMCAPPYKKTFRCDTNSRQCVEDSDGNYSSIEDCNKFCSSITCTVTINDKSVTGINTAIGCIPMGDMNAFAGWILGWAVGVGGGIAFLLIVYASFMVMTSQGNPERLKAGQELLTSAVSGLILLIFSVFILRFVGIDILKLDELGGFGKL